MSATPNNAGPEWGPSQLVPLAAETEGPARAGQDALQVLLAFACIHEQTAKRRSEGLTAESSADEYFGLDEVLRLVAMGLSTGQVATQLVLSPNTVKAHIQSIYRKLGINSRSDATRYAMGHQFI